ncbi:MAG: hypothetical protein GXP63_03540 [DPANN group archaeon]|nr:hypothetical protein [DPANN group archaeon]
MQENLENRVRIESDRKNRYTIRDDEFIALMEKRQNNKREQGLDFTWKSSDRISFTELFAAYQKFSDALEDVLYNHLKFNDRPKVLIDDIGTIKNKGTHHSSRYGPAIDKRDLNKLALHTEDDFYFKNLQAFEHYATLRLKASINKWNLGTDDIILNLNGYNPEIAAHLADFICNTGATDVSKAALAAVLEKKFKYIYDQLPASQKNGKYPEILKPFHSATTIAEVRLYEPSADWREKERSFLTYPIEVSHEELYDEELPYTMELKDHVLLQEQEEDLFLLSPAEIHALYQKLNKNNVPVKESDIFIIWSWITSNQMYVIGKEGTEHEGKRFLALPKIIDYGIQGYTVAPDLDTAITIDSDLFNQEGYIDHWEAIGEIEHKGENIIYSVPITRKDKKDPYDTKIINFDDMLNFEYNHAMIVANNNTIKWATEMMLDVTPFFLKYTGNLGQGVETIEKGTMPPAS